MQVFLTIDVESYTGNYEQEVYGDGRGLEYLLSVLARFEVKATFFVEALGATRWGEKDARRICALLRDAGYDVQLHIHPVVAEISGFLDKDDVLWNHDCVTQEMLIRTGAEILASCGVKDLTVFRAGDFAADTATLEAMGRLGITTGSNRDLDNKSSTRSKLNDLFPVRNDISQLNGIIDVPLSVVRSRLPFLDGRYRHLEISAMGADEMIDALKRMAKVGYETATILTHPAEFFRRNGFDCKPIAKNCRRLERVLGFLSGRSDMKVATMGEIGNGLTMPAVSPSEVRPNLVYSLVRVVEQVRERMRNERNS